MRTFSSFASKRLAVVVIVLVTAAHAALWHFSEKTLSAPDVRGPLASVSYAPYASSDPKAKDPVKPEQIRADLKAIAPYTSAIRLYSSTAGNELVPPIAAEFGLKVTLGIWIDKDEKRNEREIKAAVDLAKHNRNVISVVVGNETVYRADKTVPEIMEIIQKVKRQVSVPVTTGEIWSVWADHPELASAVDYVAAHILPYWEGIADGNTVDLTIKFYDRLRSIHPGKRIVIAEFGWPSAGYNRRDAMPGRMAQAQVLRDFVSRADALGIDYNVIEAIDQPWKTFEGSVGPYWGLFDASRAPKFAWTGPVHDPDHQRLATIAVIGGILISLPILLLGAVTLGQALLLSVAAQAVGAWTATVYAYWDGHYFVPGAAFALGLGLALLMPLIMIALSRLQEIAEIAFGRGPRRAVPQAATGYTPKVSIHIPAYREPPEMLKATLDSIARLDYPNLECIVIINNTPDPALWRPVEEHCKTLGERFKFLNVQNLSGFKAGALRLALEHTADDAEIIGVIDADYAVTPDWLRDLVPAFADPEVGLVQAPQDHRDGDRSLTHRLMNGEYAGFFDVGMVQRNEVNAIIVHGTMCLIRRTALASAGGWSSDTICEDSDLGLAILEQGWHAHYTNRRYGYGLLPDTFAQFKTQRHRWAYGGVQIVKKHWRRFLPGASRLTPQQRRDFTIGWVNWLGAESLGVVVAIFNLLWVPVVAFLGIAVPDKVLTLPILAAFAVSLTHFIAVYRMRVAIRLPDMIGAVFAAMSVQWTVARAVSDGVIKDHLPFVRTAKGGGAKRDAFAARSEAIMGALLVLGSAVLVVTNYEQVREIYFFALALAVQSLPFLAATGIAMLERSRMNEAAFWTALGERFTLATLRRPTVAPAPVVAVEKQAEPAQ
jgi:exo-beta-1,3-glucanase (GH17 family)/cellulose synthase/poly-beta-1,6-N-acetylglucosamine synthase-like glycosyltransferase